MSGILKRTIFLGKGADGFFRIASWARVITSLGHMMEPRGRNLWGYALGHSQQDHDWKEMMSRIDEVEGYDPSGPMYDENTIGGDTMPVDGY